MGVAIMMRLMDMDSGCRAEIPEAEKEVGEAELPKKCHGRGSP